MGLNRSRKNRRILLIGNTIQSLPIAQVQINLMKRMLYDYLVRSKKKHTQTKTCIIYFRLHYKAKLGDGSLII